jgi:hypothetical protein
MDRMYRCPMWKGFLLVGALFLPYVLPLNALGAQAGPNGHARTKTRSPISAADNDTDRLSRRRLERALFLHGLRVFARHNGLIGRDRLLLCRPAFVAQPIVHGGTGILGGTLILPLATAKASRSFPKHSGVTDLFRDVQRQLAQF